MVYTHAPRVTVPSRGRRPLVDDDEGVRPRVDDDVAPLGRSFLSRGAISWAGRRRGAATAAPGRFRSRSSSRARRCRASSLRRPDPRDAQDAPLLLLRQAAGTQHRVEAEPSGASLRARVRRHVTSGSSTGCTPPASASSEMTSLTSASVAVSEMWVSSESPGTRPGSGRGARTARCGSMLSIIPAQSPRARAGVFCGAMRLRAVLGNLAVAALSVILVLLALEGALRVVRKRQGSGKEEATLGRYSEHDPVLGWRKRPGARATYNRREYRVEIVINSRGLRDPERGYAAAPETFRVLALGDSFVEGYMVPLASTATQVLEKSLRVARLPGRGPQRRHLGLQHRPGVPVLPGRGLPLRAEGRGLFFYYNDVYFNSVGSVLRQPQAAALRSRVASARAEARSGRSRGRRAAPRGTGVRAFGLGALRLGAGAANAGRARGVQRPRAASGSGSRSARLSPRTESEGLQAQADARDRGGWEVTRRDPARRCVTRPHPTGRGSWSCTSRAAWRSATATGS